MRRHSPALGSTWVETASRFPASSDQCREFDGDVHRTVEVYRTSGGLADDVLQVAIAFDAQAERPFLPARATLQGRVILADRGYPDVS